ncbi:MAG: hypothetical protein JNM13_11375 [Hyphomicrobiaceae bacterium]|nr:hypothetical protein [Hyphomicrobiaceae bacterium]
MTATIKWGMGGWFVLDQLPPREQARINHALKTLAERTDRLDSHGAPPVDSRFKYLSDGKPVFAVAVGRDYDVLIRVDGDTIEVVDIIALQQMRALGAIERLGQSRRPRRIA